MTQNKIGKRFIGTYEVKIKKENEALIKYGYGGKVKEIKALSEEAKKGKTIKARELKGDMNYLLGKLYGYRYR